MSIWPFFRPTPGGERCTTITKHIPCLPGRHTSPSHPILAVCAVSQRLAHVGVAHGHARAGAMFAGSAGAWTVTVHGLLAGRDEPARAAAAASLAAADPGHVRGGLRALPMVVRRLPRRAGPPAARTRPCCPKDPRGSMAPARRPCASPRARKFARAPPRERGSRHRPP